MQFVSISDVLFLQGISSFKVQWKIAAWNLKKRYNCEKISQISLTELLPDFTLHF